VTIHRGAQIIPIYKYTTLDDPLASGRLGTHAVGINNAGQIVGEYSDAAVIVEPELGPRS
jgi:hypothetical protein